MAYTTIKKPSDYFNTKLYTGNGSTNAITGVGFQPDFTWIKSRTEGYGHSLFDAVRGVTKAIASDGTGAEYTFSTGLTAFGSDGFTLGSGTVVNNNSQNHASWNWKANGAGSANTDGSISSTVSASATSGFSVVTYTGNNTNGATVGHGLGVIPSMVIVKKLSATRDWMVKHKDLTSNHNISLNTTAAQFNSPVNGWISNLTSNQTISFSIGSSDIDNVNQGAQQYVAYCFADVQGYSKFGSYTGNGNADGTFVYTGFKPAWVMMKNTSNATSSNWLILDNKRDTYNVADSHLDADNSDAESSASWVNTDFLSNGFKLRTSDETINESTNTFIYMAFAEQPLVGDNPATAR